jgi:hypothetical protein
MGLARKAILSTILRATISSANITPRIMKGRVFASKFRASQMASIIKGIALSRDFLLLSIKNL